MISKDDHVSLRSALVAEGVRPGVPLLVTVFDRDVAIKLESAVRNVRVISMADVVVPSIAAAAHACREDLRTLLRAGRGEMMSETRSLLKLGVVRDVYRVGGTLIAAMALGSPAREAFLHERVVYLVTPDGSIEPFVEAAANGAAALAS